MNWLELSQIATPIVAVGALALSTYNTVAQRRDRDRSLFVELSIGLHFDDFGPPGEMVLLLKAGNRSSSDITATSCSLRLPGPSTVPFMPTSLPQKLSNGDGFTEILNLAELKAGMRETGMDGSVSIRGILTDATGREHRSRKALLLTLS